MGGRRSDTPCARSLGSGVHDVYGLGVENHLQVLSLPDLGVIIQNCPKTTPSIASIKSDARIWKPMPEIEEWR